MYRHVLSLSIIPFALLVACKEDPSTTGEAFDGGVHTGGVLPDPTADSTTSDSTSPTTGATPDGATTGDDTTTGDPATTDGTTSGEPPKPILCGDGVIDAGEECDDGNDVANDACTPLCTLPECGDGVTQDNEECDAGVFNGPGKACLDTCKSNACGDGDQGPGEGCDDGNLDDGDACTAGCKLATCGDGKLGQGEQCDDGNDVNTDMCTDACTLPVCGDAYVQPGEQCDHSNLNSDNASCTSTCKIGVCGDALVHIGVETCDDGAGNNGPGEACLATCMKNVCGDGDQGPAEECDLGAQNGNGECHTNCKLDVCGDKIVGAGETCDDGNQTNGDGCSVNCVKEVKCGIKLYKCGNGLDDDGDGDIDLDDPECTSPCDDAETSYQTLLPGQNEDCKSDCYWDADSGVGNDHCEWNLQCDTEDPGADIGCGYDSKTNMCTPQVPQICLDVCVPLIPNGCDCFGCCEIAGQFVYLNSNPQCSLDNLDACNSCTFYPQCANACEPEKCELCFGQDLDDLPPECNDTPKCEPGKTPCEDISDCQAGQFCQTGCCVAIVPG